MAKFEVVEKGATSCIDGVAAVAGVTKAGLGNVK
jgi:hypothetical protein